MSEELNTRTHAIDERELTIYQLNAELVELMQLREETPHDTYCSGVETCDCSVAIINARIGDYVSANARKIDNITSFVLWRRSQVEMARKEAQRLARLADRWDEEEAFLLQLCKPLVAAAPGKKLEGNRSVISVRTNGGVLGVNITEPEKIPVELCDYTLYMDYESYRDVPEKFRYRPNVRVVRQPNNKLVRAALEKACSLCGASGVSPCAHDGGAIACELCGGSGKARVAGASFNERGSTVQVK